MSTFRALLFATAALCASVSFVVGALGSTTGMPCTPASIEQRLATLDATVAGAQPTDPADQHRLAETAAYARAEVARFAPADRHQACRFLDRMVATTAGVAR